MKCWLIEVYLVCSDQLICQKLHSRKNITATGSYFPMQVSHGNRGRINHPASSQRLVTHWAALLWLVALQAMLKPCSMSQTASAQNYAFLAAAATRRYAPELALGVALLFP